MNSSLQRELNIFEEALKFTSPEERQRFLVQACAGDATLLARLQELLRTATQTSSFLAHPPDDLRTLIDKKSAEAPFSAANEKPGDHIGRYKLLQQIGEGGMGVVYMAEQEQPIRRRVALKVIKVGMDTKAVVARFEAERQALALMDHPNIARVLDGGATETGRPYFVMELVHGVPITEYCEKTKLPTRGRLQLFVQVCQAIQSAHQKGIIHRDIKPSNVLVTLHHGEPMPKIIDFGVAKATNQKLTEKTLFTQFATMIGTPAYMSPEQAEMSSMDVDTRADIYSLGVLLYALLTGTTPFPEKRLRSLGYGEMQRVIAEEEPERPSTRLDTMANEDKSILSNGLGGNLDALLAQLRGDLDWIVMKCLEKDRARRYETANGLAADLKRHMDGEPIVARPPSTAYRLQKAWHRNRAAFSALLAVVLALTLGFVISGLMYFREHAARLRAATAEEQAKQKQHQLEAAHSALAASDKERYRQLYAAEMSLARTAWENGHLAKGLELLSHHLPEPGREDLRGFEWRYLWSLCQGDAKHTLKEHRSYVQTLAVSFSRNEFATGGGDALVHIWDSLTYAKKVTLRASEEVRSMAYSPVGDLLAVGDYSESLRVWNTQNYTESTTLGPLKSGEKHVRFFPGGSTLACSHDDGKVTIWNVPNRQLLANLKGEATTRPALAIAPTGATLAAASGNNEILIWDPSTHEKVKQLNAHSGNVVWLEYSPDGSLLASSSSDGTVRLWDASSWREAAVLRGHGVWVSSANFSPDGSKLITATVDGLIRVWDVPSRNELRRLRGHSAWVNTTGFLPDSRTLISVSDDQTAKIWEIDQTIENGQWKTLDKPAIDFRLGSNGGTLTLLSADSDGSRQIDLLNRGTFSPLPGKYIFSYTSGRNLLDLTVRITDPGHFEIIHSETQQLICRSSEPVGTNFWAEFSDDQEIVVMLSDAEQSAWKVKDGTLIRKRSHQSIFGWRFGAKILQTRERRVLLLDYISKNRIRYWDLSTGAETDDPPAGITLTPLNSPSGQRIIWISDSRGSGYPSMWSSPNNPDDQIHSWLLLKKQQSLIIGGARDITIWNLASGQEIARLSGRSGWVRGLACSDDERTLVSAGNDGALKLWNLDLKREVFTFPSSIAPHTDALRFASDQNTIAALSYEDRQLRVFTAPTLSIIESALKTSPAR